MKNTPEDKDIDKIFKNSIDNMETEPSDQFWSKVNQGIRKAENNNIDNVLRNSIDKLETEPSDSFWTKAYESILQNEARNYEQSLWKWRSAVAILVVAVAGLVGYGVYTNNKVNSVEQRISNLENKQLQAVNNQVTSASNSDNTSSVNAKNGVNVAATNNNNPVVTSNTETVASLHKNNPIVQNTNAVASEDISVSRVKSLHNNANNNTASEKQFVASNASRTANYSRQESLSTPLFASSNQQISRTFGRYDRSFVNNVIYLENKSNADLSIPSPGNVMPSSEYLVQDSNNIIPVERQPFALTVVKVSKSKFSVSAFGAPSFSLPIVRTNKSYDPLAIKNIESREHRKSAFDFGMNVGYDLSRKWTVQLGCNYRTFSYTIDPTSINPVNNIVDGPSYTLATRSGVVTKIPFIVPNNLPPGQMNYALVPAIANGSGLRTSFSIPADIKYNFVPRHGRVPKFRLYAKAGGSANFQLNNSATVLVWNQYGQESVSVDKMDGSNKVNFSYMTAIGGEYLIGKGFRVTLEPGYTGAITPVTTKAAPMYVYPGYLDVAVGLTYHF